ncbi:MAG: hypothetical protein AB1420_01340 [Bacillota bacterium]
MEIEVYDYISPQNHFNLNKNLIESLAGIGKVKVVANQGYYSVSEINLENVSFVELQLTKFKNSMLGRKLNALFAMIKTRKQFNKYSDSFKIIFTFDTVAFGLGRYSLNLNELFLMHHKNIDELKDPIKRLIFKSYMNKVNHIVFEEIFKTYLVKEIGVHENRVFVVPHPVFNQAKSKNFLEKYDCVGLSNSNDDEFIRKIIEIERASCFTKRNNLHIVLRSKLYQFDNGFLKVISGFLQKCDYDDYINSSKLVFVPLPQTYNYRVSGAIFDAFSNHKFVVANNVPIVEEYKKRYPKICIGINNVDDFFNVVVENKNNSNKDTNSFKDFIDDHSRLIIRKRFKEAFVRVEKDEDKKK